MERSWQIAAVVGIAALVAGRASMESALSRVPLWCVFLCGIVLGWWACCKVYLNDHVHEGAASKVTRSFIGTYRDPQKEEEWFIRETGTVSLCSGTSGRMLSGWVADEVLTVQFPNKIVSGWLEGQQLVWRSRAEPWVRC